MPAIPYTVPSCAFFANTLKNIELCIRNGTNFYDGQMHLCNMRYARKDMFRYVFLLTP